ncbi:MAG: acyl-CoA dehydrogenase [Rhodovulum sp.]|nr:acyl-CoA dehydrogenase [Rhodovulum sp.]
MIPFAAPLDDILFSLDAVGASDLPDYDRDLTAELGGFFAQFAEGELAPINMSGDEQGARLIDGRVKMPDGFGAAYTAYAEQGWQGLCAPEEFGGQEQNGLIGAVTSEIFIGANHSLQMVVGLVPGAIRTILNFGTPEQQARYIPALVEGRAISTMALTEAGAGSDLSRIRCRAVEGDNSGWTISGEKIFISGGDQDLSEEILHLVLARTSDDGVKGLSLFACPSHLPDGTRNPITITRIEEKMGLHASPTCQMAFDGAHAELLGKPGQGLAAMFTMMNHARLDVSLQGVAHAARATQIARAYAADRTQGRTEAGDATLDQHPDVIRMLDEMDALALSARAVAHFAMVNLERGDQNDLVDFLTPVAKVFCTESGLRAADTGIQVLGGYGYLTEYGVSQVWRDARITAIYEGANGIHALATATRGVNYGAGADRFAEVLTDMLGESSIVSDWIAARDVLRAEKRAAPELAHDFMQMTAWALTLGLWGRLSAAGETSHAPDRIARLSRLVAIRFAPEFTAARDRFNATRAMAA